jgi:hypothetical protein
VKYLIPLIVIFLSSNVFSEDALYQIHEAKDGRVLRLNMQTGAVHLITNKGLDELSENSPDLKVGKYYEMEDGLKEEKYLKYLGNGKFEKSKFAILSIK